MNDLVTMHIFEDYIVISFDAGDDQIMEIGKNMNEICEEAYMNGYNWEAFLNCYLEQNAPEILDEIDTDPEADMYSASIEGTDADAVLVAKKFKGIIEDLLEHEGKIMEFLEENADQIEWD